MFKAPLTNDTRSFYDRLIEGSVNRSIWGVNNRFCPDKIANALSTKIHYENLIQQYCHPSAKALDIGCSTGGFTSLLAKYCESVTGVDVSDSAVAIANSYFSERNLDNCKAFAADGSKLSFDDESFHMIQMLDVVHHAENPEALCREVHRLLRPDGKLIVFEPNKYNLALWLMCVLDKNEWGALRFGSICRYQSLFSECFDVQTIEYNGLLIGPDGKVATRIANWLSSKKRAAWLKCQSPKIFICLKKGAPPVPKSDSWPQIVFDHMRAVRHKKAPIQRGFQGIPGFLRD